MCEAGRNEDAVEMVNALARLFRISISRGHELIPIEKELQHAQSFLHIQNFRYKISSGINLTLMRHAFLITVIKSHCSRSSRMQFITAWIVW